MATLSEATGGELSRCRLHRELTPVSGLRGDSLRAAFVSGGACWGAVSLARSDPGAPFTQADVSFVASVCAHVAEGLRAAILLAALARPRAREEEPEEPGLVILRGDEVRSASASAEAWLEELASDFGGAPAGRLHAGLLAVGAAAGATGGADPPPSARVVLRTRSGRWLGMHGLRLESGSGEPEVAIIMEAARPPELAAVVMTAYGLSPRERQVAQQIVSGASTAEACGALHISPYTLQDHLKSIFDKVGVRSRADLAKQVFDRHFAGGRL